MKTNVFKVIGLLFLLTISFIYTEKIFTISRNNDPLMKDILEYKKDNDYKPVNGVIIENEITLGLSGSYIDSLDSYKNMKENESFDENKIIEYKEKPENSIEKNYDYYITSSNKIKKNIYIIIKINSNEDLKKLNKLNNNFALFINQNILENYFINTNLEIYNLGKNGKYDDVKDINRIINENYNKSLFCLNEYKEDKYKIVCKKNKMYSIKPTLVNPTINGLKNNLENGIIISFDINNLSTNRLMLIINIIESKGYKIDRLSNLIKE